MASAPSTASEWAATGALIDYVELTQKGRLPRIAPATGCFVEGSVMAVRRRDSRISELVRKFSGDLDQPARGQHRSHPDRGLAMPSGRVSGGALTDPQTIAIGRCRAVLRHRRKLREAVRNSFRSVPDIGRALSRLSLHAPARSRGHSRLTRCGAGSASGGCFHRMGSPAARRAWRPCVR